MMEHPVHVLVRYTTGHRARLSRGWQRYGDRTPLEPEVAMLIATCLRARGAEVQIKPTT
ncbi:MAG: hypothetical protein ACI8S6_002921 [Myxococcota bacterium]|jgi:hypothetical protein